MYTQYKNFQIAYHVANMIPVSNPDVDTQRIGRKRHLGNDVVLIIFKDGMRFDLTLNILTYFNSIYT